MLIRTLIGGLSYVAIVALRPIKMLAYRSPWRLPKRLILEATAFVDWCLIWLNLQNGVMLLHWRAYGGNFLFGKAVMVTDHHATKRAIACPAHRGNNFMGVDIVSSDPNVFATNTGIL